MTNVISKYTMSLGAGLLLLGITSCSNEEYLGGYIATDQIGSEVHVKASISSVLEPGVALQEGASYGLSTSYEDNTSVNREYISGPTEDSVSSGTEIYLKATANLIAVYPYSGSAGSEQILELSTLKQSAITPIFYGVSETVTRNQEGVVPIAMKDIYGKVTFKITVPEGESVKSYRLTNVYQEGTLKTLSGTYTYQSAASDLTGALSGNTFTLTLIPQEITEEQGATLTIVGAIRTYSVALKDVVILPDTQLEATVNLTDGIGTIEFTNGGGQWSDSGAGGDIHSGN